jgi:hypothetical protein
MAQAASCNRITILRISSNIRNFGSVKASPNKGGLLRSITPFMLEALCDHLLENLKMYLDEMMIFLWDEFAFQATKSSISRALASKGWSKKTGRIKARERNLDHRDEYLHYTVSCTTTLPTPDYSKSFPQTPPNPQPVVLIQMWLAFRQGLLEASICSVISGKSQQYLTTT